jgi:hypothetical protein
MKNEKPAGGFAGGLGCVLDLLSLIASGRSSPPAWSIHDGGDGHDGGGSASVLTISEDLAACQMDFGST